MKVNWSDACITEVFYKEDIKRWFWYCMTCHSGGDKWINSRYALRGKRKTSGHKRKSDAETGATYHRRDILKHKARLARYEKYVRGIKSITDPQEFHRHCREYFGYTHEVDDATALEFMLAIKNVYSASKYDKYN